MTKLVLLTGLNGTVAPVVAEALRREGSTVVAWDRSEVPETDLPGSRRHLEAIRPETVFHIGMGPPGWAALLAEWCREHDRCFVFTSTVSVFSGASDRPYTVDDEPDATDEYGRYKRACEQAVLAANGAALIVRLGWQIGDRPGSNNMVDYFERTAVERALELSRNQFPGCSFLEDTADALLSLHSQGQSGLYHLDGNPGLSLFEIGLRLSRLHDGRWQIRPRREPHICTLMEDKRVRVRSVTERLGTGPGGG